MREKGRKSWFGNVANANDGEERERRWKKRDNKAEREGGEVVEGGGGAGEYTVQYMEMGNCLGRWVAQG